MDLMFMRISKAAEKNLLNGCGLGRQQNDNFTIRNLPCRLASIRIDVCYPAMPDFLSARILALRESPASAAANAWSAGQCWNSAKGSGGCYGDLI